MMVVNNSMDACLEIWIPEVRLGGSVARNVRVVSWGGEEFTDDLGGWTSPAGVDLREGEAPAHIVRRLPAGFTTAGWKYFRVEGPALAMAAVGGDGQDAAWSALTSVLCEQLTPGGPWVVIFEPHCDQIDTVVEVDLAQVLSLLGQGVRREESALGFVAYCRGGV
ncbi:hypothetical protein HUW62_34075 [Myxococcus sp. AM011]|uniref:hypothetical protein n=1 Tax=Myxococcus sp. AM011 TaxID=2745200 RepID=UPI00159559CA|nr:hypothetical protein [Myxococcus sp. AM011]NVJ26262.1 hypothetical protein [Myxococcus sp. AM011]